MLVVPLRTLNLQSTTHLEIARLSRVSYLLVQLFISASYSAVMASEIPHRDKPSALAVDFVYMMIPGNLRPMFQGQCHNS